MNEMVFNNWKVTLYMYYKSQGGCMEYVYCTIYIYNI